MANIGTYVHIFLKRKIAFVLQHLNCSINNRAQTLVLECLSGVSEVLRSHGVKASISTPPHTIPTSLIEGGQHHAWARERTWEFVLTDLSFFFFNY